VVVPPNAKIPWITVPQGIWDDVVVILPWKNYQRQLQLHEDASD
jgi:hypothetical protein